MEANKNLTSVVAKLFMREKVNISVVFIFKVPKYISLNATYYNQNT